MPIRSLSRSPDATTDTTTTTTKATTQIHRSTIVKASLNSSPIVDSSAGPLT
ncbi:hypothetical protein [Microlunatus phosphovorus]|uniref:hypothetical protein n=1 Tax=Microlunatus phosphovorus TaxID=29405 RepID=UPI0012EA4B0B|nr:hypothetical protein [Microlunatus phosphovorus]